MAVEYRGEEDASLTCSLSSCGEIAGNLSDAHLVSYMDLTFSRDFDQGVRWCNSNGITSRSRLGGK